MPVPTRRIWSITLLLGLLFDYLFWGKPPGISFAIYVTLCLVAGFALLRSGNLSPARGTLWLLPPLIILSIMTFLRSEPMSLFLAHTLTLFLMALLAMTFLGGLWPRYSLADYAWRLLRLAASITVRGATSLAEASRQQAANGESGDAITRFKAILSGLLLALPILAVFAALLSSADPVFARRLNDLTDLFRLEKLPEYLFRAVIVFLVAYTLAGVFLHAATQSKDDLLLGMEKPLLPSFLGITEASIVLGSVLLLFAFFVTIQFQYFFGGQTNITIEGYTYAEYARRGFGELVTVAFFTLLLLLGLSTVTRREGRERRLFSALGGGLVALTLIILLSAFQRLLLYEEAYGFSRLRTYTHVFIPWLGILLISVVLLEALHRQRFVPASALLTALGFAITLNLLNVDAFIVRQNVARHARGEELDIAYLATLSDDAVPALADLYQSPSPPSTTHQAIGAALACYRRLNVYTFAGERPWQSFRLPRQQAKRILAHLETDLDAYTITDDWPILVTTPDGEEFNCVQDGYD